MGKLHVVTAHKKVTLFLASLNSHLHLSHRWALGTNLYSDMDFQLA